MKASVKLVTKRNVQTSTGLTIVQVGMRSGAKSQMPARSGNKKAGTSKKDWKWQRGVVTHPQYESQWNRGHSSMKKWESEKHKCRGIPAEGFKGHVATDGSLFGHGRKVRSMLLVSGAIGL